MAAYVIMAVTKVLDQEQLMEYRRQAIPMLEATPGLKFFAGPMATSLEGPDISLVVMVELPDLDAAKRWYHSEEYQKIASLRQGATEGFGFIVESWNGFGS